MSITESICIVIFAIAKAIVFIYIAIIGIMAVLGLVAFIIFLIIAICISIWEALNRHV